MTKVFKYGVLVVLFSCILVFVGATTDEWWLTSLSKTPVEVANLLVGILTYTLKLAT